MKIRLKFTKTGPIRFVGHLDFMRAFQRWIQRSGLDAVYSAGFNPHMLMSFAAPLGTGEETLGDYADVDFAYRDHTEMDSREAYRLKDLGLDNDTLPDPPHSGEFCRILTDAMPEGVTVTDAVRVGLTKGSKAMALVRYASWNIEPAAGSETGDRILCPDAGQDSKAGRSGLFPDPAAAEEFLCQPQILYRKATKSGEKDVDIRPMIRSFAPGNGSTWNLICASGSSVNLKPGAVLESFAAYSGADFDPYSFRLTRTDLYDADMHPLSVLGTPF